MKFNFVDASSIMGAVFALIILAVGVFAFFTTIQSIEDAVEDQPKVIDEATKNLNPVLNVIAVVLIIGAIMTIIGLVYYYVRRPSSSYFDDDKLESILEKTKPFDEKPPAIEPKRFDIKEKPKKKKEGWQI